ncbi:MAG TPA: protein kinase [Pyrinomonadaceae bacterium]|jgi:serine/threonine protein kinase
MNEGEYIRGYRLKREIGRGSYGDVWLAEKQMDFGGACVYYALKILRNRSGEGIDIEKVIKEIVAWTKASAHANVIAIRDSFTEHGKYVIVSDYADGGSLKNRTFAAREAARIIEGVLEGVEYLHRIPIIHRDIKPENILLKNGVPCISDFGLAREFDKTQSTGLAGSINYFSPEMAKKELGYEAHERTPLDDLWATAVTFYQIVTGELPFKKLGHIIKCQREAAPENLSKELAEFFEKAFHRKRSRRFQSAREMRKALRKAVCAEDSPENKIEELALQLSDLQFKILESQNNANLLYKMVAEERVKSRQLATEKQEAEKKTAAEKANAQKLRDELGDLRSEFESLRARLAETTAENAKLKKRLRVLKRQFIPTPTKIRGQNLLPIPLEQAFFDAGNDYLDKKEYDQAIAQFTEAIELDSENASAYYQRGIAYNGRGVARGDTEDFDNAIRDYYQATFLKENEPKTFRDKRPAVFHTVGFFKQFVAGRDELSVKDYQRLLKLHPVFNNAYEELKKAKRKRRRETLRFAAKWALLLAAFSGLYVSTYHLARPFARSTAGYLRRQLYDSGQLGEHFVSGAVIASSIAFAVFLVIGMFVGLKNVTRERVSESLLLTICSGAGLLLSGYLIYSFFLTVGDYPALAGFFN